MFFDNSIFAKRTVKLDFRFDETRSTDVVFTGKVLDVVGDLETDVTVVLALLDFDEGVKRRGWSINEGWPSFLVETEEYRSLFDGG